MSGDGFAPTAALLLAIGLYGLLSRSDLIHRLIAINIMGSAVFLLLIRVAAARPATPDPVPHAMVLTGIVIAISLTAFGLALTRHFRHLAHRAHLAEDQESSDADV